MAAGRALGALDPDPFARPARFEKVQIVFNAIGELHGRVNHHLALGKCGGDKKIDNKKPAAKQQGEPFPTYDDLPQQQQSGAAKATSSMSRMEMPSTW